MTTIFCTVLVLLLLPALFLLWLTESRQQRARRWRRDGLTYRVIAERLGCSQTTARRLVAA
jgi:response regulator RpfG family c-di-GMP phosphodiesterase